jgi:hypothetical protein
MFYLLEDEPNSNPAEWDSDKIISDRYKNCPADPGHPKIGLLRTNDLHIKLHSPKVPDILSTWYSEFIVTDKVAELFRDNNLTGYELRPVVVTSILHGEKDISQLPKLWELKVSGWGGIAPEESGIKLIFRCPDCDMIRYSALQYADKLIDSSQWDGSDFFFVWPMPGYIFITEKAKNIMESHKIGGVKYTPYIKMKTGTGIFGPCPLWHYIGKERAEKLGRPLGIE